MKEITRVYTVSFTQVLNGKKYGSAFPKLVRPAKETGELFVKDMKEIFEKNGYCVDVDLITLDNVQEFVNDSDEHDSYMKKAKDAIEAIKMEIRYLKTCGLDAIGIILGAHFSHIIAPRHNKLEAVELDCVREEMKIFGIPVEIDHKNLDRIEIVSGRSIVR